MNVWHRYHGASGMAWTAHLAEAKRKSVCGLRIKGIWLDPERHATPPRNACHRCVEIAATKGMLALPAVRKLETSE